MGRVSPSRVPESACICAGGRIYTGACETRLNETPFSQPLAPMATVAAGRGDSGGGSGCTYTISCLSNKSCVLSVGMKY